jgi:hypothetical protein
VTLDVPKRMPVDCGYPIDEPGRYCTVQLWRTYAPAGSLWCPVHGHVVDVNPTTPGDLVGRLCSDDAARSTRYRRAAR